MSRLHIFPDAILRSRCSKVDRFDEPLYMLGRDLIQFVRDPANKAQGIAAPQLGYRRRVIAVRGGKGKATAILMVNPVIEWKAPGVWVAQEGCLSMPGVICDVTRVVKIGVRWQNVIGVMNRGVFEGTPSRRIQHEIDHLDGILITDRGVRIEAA